MSNSEERERQQQLPYIDPALIIDTRFREIERERAEEKRQQQEYNRKQLRFNGLLVLFTALLFLTSIVSDVLTLRYVGLTKQSADAASSAATTASTAQGQMKSSGEETKAQIDRLIAQEQRTADAMDGSLQQTIRAVNQTSAQLAFQHESFQLEQRPYLAIKAMRFGDIERPNEDIGFPVKDRPLVVNISFQKRWKISRT